MILEPRYAYVNIRLMEKNIKHKYIYAKTSIAQIICVNYKNNPFIFLKNCSCWEYSHRINNTPLKVIGGVPEKTKFGITQIRLDTLHK